MRTHAEGAVAVDALLCRPAQLVEHRTELRVVVGDERVALTQVRCGVVETSTTPLGRVTRRNSATAVARSVTWYSMCIASVTSTPASRGSCRCVLDGPEALAACDPLVVHEPRDYGPIMDVTTTAVVAGGAALARAADGRVVFVDGALPGERVRITVRSEHKDHLHADVADVLDASPDRVPPPCVHRRAGCGGCPWQHIAPAAQPRYKRALIEDALRRIARVPDPPLQPTVVLPVGGYRTTVRALVVDSRPAFRRRHAHDAVPIERCLIAHPLVDEILRHGRFGKAREITVRASAATGERLVLPDPERARIEVPEDVRVGGRAHVTEVINGRRFVISARSFFQTRPDGAAALAALVRDAVGPDRTVADLYAGVGLFGGSLVRPRRLYSVERSGPATRDARRNLAGIDARIIRADVEHFRPPEPVDVVIADPPRSGLGRGGTAVVVACRPERVVLVSCDAAALARDVTLLDRAGFALVSITPVDLFGHTAHVECVTVFDRR